MSYEQSVYIGPEFFTKAKQDYSNWHWAIVREYLQNCIDAPRSTTVNIQLGQGADTTLTVTNDGEPMTKDELINKLLALGGTGKAFQGTVGGFGKAKEIIYFCHKDYLIRTGPYRVQGAGAGYNLTEETHYDGTSSTITLEGNQRDALDIQIRLFAQLSQWKGQINLNGKALTDRTNKGARRKDFTWGTVYTNQSAQGVLLVRINGVPMFTKPVNYRGMVLIELIGNSGEVLTSSRDGLKYTYQSNLDSFLAEIAVNTRSAFKDRSKPVKRTVYAGYKLAGKYTTVAADTPEERVQKADLVLAANIAAATTGAKDAPTLTVQQVQAVFRPEFHIRDELGAKIPEWFLPHAFSEYSKRLASNWISLLVELATLTSSTAPFAVGFVFDNEDEGLEGLFEREGTQRVIYVNPVSVVENPGKPRQLKTKWKFDAIGCWKLLSLAVHEFVHFQGFSGHDEDYAGALTDLMALVLANRTRFSRHFNKICWPS